MCHSPDEFSVAPVIMKDAECSLVDETLALRRTGASSQNVSKISFSAIKLSTREHSASFIMCHYQDNTCDSGLCHWLIMRYQ